MRVYRPIRFSSLGFFSSLFLSVPMSSSMHSRNVLWTTYSVCISLPFPFTFSLQIPLRLFSLCLFHFKFESCSVFTPPPPPPNWLQQQQQQQQDNVSSIYFSFFLRGSHSYSSITTSLLSVCPVYYTLDNSFGALLTTNKWFLDIHYLPLDYSYLFALPCLALP